MKRIPLLVTLLALALPLAAAAAKEKSDKKEEKEEKEEKGGLNAATFAGLEFRSLGPALTSGRIGDIAVDPTDHGTWYVAGGLGRSLEDHQRRHHLDADLRRRGLVLDRLRGDRSQEPARRSGSAPARTTASAASATATASTSPIDGGKHLEQRRPQGLRAHRQDPRSTRATRTSSTSRRQGPLWNDGRRPRPLQDHRRRQDLERRCSRSDEDTGVTDVAPRPAQPRRALRRGLPAPPPRLDAHRRRARSRRIHKSTDGGKTWTQARARACPRRTWGGSGSRSRRSTPTSSTPSSRPPTRRAASSARPTAARAGRSAATTSARSPQYYQELVRRSDAPRPRLLDGHLPPGHRRRRQDLARRWARSTSTSTTTRMWIDPDDTDHLPRGLRRRALRELRPRRDLALHRQPAASPSSTRSRVDNATPFYNVYGGTQDNYTLGGPSRTAQRARHPQRGLVRHARAATASSRAVDPEDPNIVYSQFQHGVLAPLRPRTGEAMLHPAAGRAGRARRCAGTGTRR